MKTKYKILIPFISVPMIAIAATIIALIFAFSSFATNNEEVKLSAFQNILDEELKSMQSVSEHCSALMAQDSVFVRAMTENDRETMFELAAMFANGFEMDFCTVVDINGNVILRTHQPDKFGDSLAEFEYVSEPLSGRRWSNMDIGVLVKLSIIASEPIYSRDGTLIGAVFSGMRLDDNVFVDRMKDLTGLEATIFLGDERLSTTVLGENGQRAVGTKAAPEVSGQVLAGNPYFGIANVAGREAYASYSPLMGPGGKAIGMVFIGEYKTASDKAVMDFIVRGIIIAAVIIALIVPAGIFLTSLITNPLRRLAGLISDVRRGNLNVNIDKSKISKEEIGQMTAEVYSLIDIIKMINADLIKLVHEYSEKGDYEYNINSSHYEGSFKEMIESTNGLIAYFNNIVFTMLNALGEIGDGNFNVELVQMPGKKVILNTRFDDLMAIIRNIHSDLSGVVGSAAEGRLDIKIDTGKYRGEWAEIMNDLNQLTEAVVSPINEMNSVMAHVAAGDFSQKMAGNYKGDFMTIKNSINNTITNIASYIDEISNVLGALADRNLDQDIKREYVGKFSDIKEALLNIITQFNSVLTDIYSASDQVAEGSRMISDSSMSLASGSTEQAASIQELNSRIQTINENTHKNNASAKEANSLSDQLKNNAEKGSESMTLMLKSMDEIKGASDKVSQIIKVIEDIAFQTNLLALNAAVEAARAGAHGKGFSVVADEVRSLAAKSQVSAKETAHLIEESISRVNDGKDNANRTADTLRVMVDDVTKVAGIIKNIAASSEEQSGALDQVVSSVDQITEVVQSNSASAQETASASQELASQSDILKEMVMVFNLKKVDSHRMSFVVNPEQTEFKSLR